MSGQSFRRILVIRPDRIGDVVLSTPVLEALKIKFPQSEIYMLVRDAVVPVVEQNPFINGLISYRPESEHLGLSGIRRLAQEIRDHSFDLAVTLQVDAKVSLALALAGVGVRVGPLSKWFSFAAFNLGQRQNRSAVEMHEAEYNLRLLNELGIETDNRRFEPKVIADQASKNKMRAFLNERGVVENQSFVAVHPGMGGSALNWRRERYAEFIRVLALKGLTVFVTGGSHEKTLVETIIDQAKSERSDLTIHSFIGASSKKGLSEMIALLSFAKVMVAPSTGPLHVAAALGKRTVSFYPPIKVQSAKRWGPYSIDRSRHTILIPDVPCVENFQCAGEKCQFYFCMDRLTVDKAVESVFNQWGAST